MPMDYVRYNWISVEHLWKRNFMKMSNEQNKGILNSVFLGYFVLLLHVLLMVGLGVAVVLLKGVYDFRWVIFIVGLALIGGSGYLIYRRLKESNRRLSDMINDPALRDRTLEISLLGGMASVRVGHKYEQSRLIDVGSIPEVRQLESVPSQVNDLRQLANLLEDELISREEFDRLKKELIAE